MAGETLVAASLIGREVVDPRNRRVGWVIAVIHKATGVDVLVEGRHWLLFRRSYRFRVDEISALDDGSLLVGTISTGYRLSDLDTGAYDATGTGRR